MGNDTTQPTPIDADVYASFKQMVQDRHGHTRGVLKMELENALLEYIHADQGPSPIERLEHDIAAMKSAVIESETDGGATPETVDTHTHTDSPPWSRSPTPEKVAYLIEKLEDDMGLDLDGSGYIHSNVITQQIESTWPGFKEDTTKRIAQATVDDLEKRGWADHPSTSGLLVGPEWEAD